MPNIWAQVSLTMGAGQEDASPTNVLWFQTAVATTPYAAIAAAIKDSYDELAASFSGQVAQNGHRIKMYDLADPEPRAPVYDDTFNLDSAPSGNSLPAEVALCLSFQGTRVSGQSQARRRGRIYLGPFDVNTCDTVGRPASTLITAAVTFGDLLLTASAASADWTWVIRSRADNVNVNVDNGWVDNAFDTQRRRGLEPTSRSTFS